MIDHCRSFALTVALALVSLLAVGCGNAVSNGGGQCAEGTTECADGCVDLASNPYNCGACGNMCSEGMVCSDSECVAGCAASETECGGACVDLNTSGEHCGECGNACRADEVCTAGECGCPGDQIVCGGVCIDPQTDAAYCGASGECSGASAGAACAADQVCLDGTCTATTNYAGSLPATQGRWSYAGIIGLSGAKFLCTATYGAGTDVCTHEQLLAAQNAGELVGAQDSDNNPVTSFWIYDPNDTSTGEGNTRCINSDLENIPWSYQTHHLSAVGKYVTLNGATGTMSAVTSDDPNKDVSPEDSGCAELRAVPCCNTQVAPPVNQ